MKNKMFALAGLAALAFMTSCSEPTKADPTKAEQCANGINEECIQGTWNFDGARSIEQGTFYEGFDFTATPGQLKIYTETTKTVTGAKEVVQGFEFLWPSTSPHASEQDCNPVHGTWSLSGTTLQLKSTINNICFSPRGVTMTNPKVINTGAKVELEFGRLWFTANGFSDAGVGTEFQAYYTEVISIAANAKK